MNKQEIEKRLNKDEDRCKYCNSSSIGCGMIFCSQGYSTDMDCEGKKFILDYKIDEIISTQQLNNGWIPVSERLPNIGETVLLTVAVNRGISHEYGSVDIAWICDKENKCFYGTDGKYSHDEAIAWRQLPEPYKEVSE